MAGNFTCISGNATRDPELRFTNSGAAVAQFGVAVNRRWLNKTTNEWEEEVSFYDVVCWKDLAEHVAESVHKGERVVVSGRHDQRFWETDTGEKRSKWELTADEVGHSLRYGTTSYTKAEKSEGGSSSKGKGSKPAEAASYDYDEEPF